jgi:immunity protein 57 of polymorphic toxin system
MRNLTGFLLFLLLMRQLFFCVSSHAETLEDREIAMARHAILASLATSKHLGSGQRCIREPYACVIADPVDLSLSLIASKNSSNALYALANLLGYELDGGPAEDYTCRVLDKGARIKPFLSRVNALKLHNDCDAELTALVGRNSKLFTGTTSGGICTDQSNIEQKKKDLLEAINAKSKCAK